MYSGDLDVATRRPHGNSARTNAHLYQSTLASTITPIDTLVTTMSGTEAYKRLVATSSGKNTPRNVTQCHYRRQKYLNERRITNDEIRNLFILSYELNSYFKLFQVQPELLVVLIHDQMKEEFHRLMRTAKETIPLFYDTTFSLSDVYVSVRISRFSKNIVRISPLDHWLSTRTAH